MRNAIFIKTGFSLLTSVRLSLPKSQSSQNPNPPAPNFSYNAALLFPVLFLVGIGIVMVYSASSALAMKKFGTGYYFLKKQFFFAGLGIAAMTVCRYFPLKLLAKLVYPIILLAFFFLVILQFPGVGYCVGGAVRGIRFGGISFQPSEFARFALVLYLAYSMSKKYERLKDFYIGFLPHLLVLGMFAVLILLQPDFGSVAILGMITWMMMFIGGVRIAHLCMSLTVMIPVGAVFLLSADYRLHRLISFLDPWQHSATGGYQTIHSIMAVGTGGIFGAGIGKGYQKLFYLPEPHTDFIFSVIGEELGLVGILFILALYMLLLYKGIRIAMNAKDMFTSFLAGGLTVAIGLQVCVNMGVALALLPTKGLTLPFLSYGGTSLLLNMASVGILMNIGNEVRNEK